ncbi:unnamed protein product [Ranitomeya imitator]|uniref:Helix-turn-helix domain-containing protein n=1 Tax=Ranitomeya imitator TaxID=111125 RepID=A0ABN9KV14_9NEOB|nr:unnamed protein product [Ranitomeya imitator]
MRAEMLDTDGAEMLDTDGAEMQDTDGAEMLDTDGAEMLDTDGDRDAGHRWGRDAGQRCWTDGQRCWTQMGAEMLDTDGAEMLDTLGSCLTLATEYEFVIHPYTQVLNLELQICSSQGQLIQHSTKSIDISLHTLAKSKFIFKPKKTRWYPGCTLCASTPPSTNALLHFSSSHPPKLKRSIPVGQFLRMHRICSDEGAFHKQAADLTRRFKNRGYRHADINKGYSRALHSDRPSLLVGRPKKPSKSTDSAPRYITKFNSNWSAINNIFKRHWPILLADRVLSSQITPYPLITWRKSPTLGDVLSKEFFFFNSAGDKSYRIVHHITCNTEAIVYFALCPCNRIYIGMTTRPFKVRVQEHIRDINNSAKCSDPTLLKSIPRHFFEAHNSSPKGLNFSGGNIKQRLLQKETRWMVTLNTLSPSGLNEAISFKSFL